MEMKHLIIFAVIGIVALLGFNIINGNSHEKNREVATAVASEQPTAAVSDAGSSKNSSANIASKPLGEQPKAILDDATNKIDQAQQSEQDRLDQMNDAQ